MFMSPIQQCGIVIVSFVQNQICLLFFDSQINGALLTTPFFTWTFLKQAWLKPQKPLKALPQPRVPFTLNTTPA